MTTARSQTLLSRKRFAKKQKINFFLTVMTPLVLAVALPLLLPDVNWLTWKAIPVFVVMWYITGCLGISIGFHRYFSHRSFRAGRRTKLLLAVCGLAAAQGPLIYWVSLHRHHHASSDEPADIHSPHSGNATEPNRSSVAKWLQSHLFWIWSHDVPKAKRYAADILTDTDIKALDRLYWLILILGVLIPGFLTFAVDRTAESFLVGVYWGGIVRMVVGQNIIWSINSFCHLVGKAPFENGDQSRNIALLAVPSWGESWHNNHHHDPANPQLGTSRWQLDLGYETIKLLSWLGLALRRKPNSSYPHSAAR